MALKLDGEKLVAGSKKTGVPHATYIHYSDGVISYDDMSRLATAVTLSIPDVAIMAVLFSKSKQNDFRNFCDQKLGRKSQEPVAEAAKGVQSVKRG